MAEGRDREEEEFQLDGESLGSISADSGPDSGEARPDPMRHQFKQEVTQLPGQKVANGKRER